MSNFGFISFKKNINLNWLYDSILEINKDRFDSKLIIAKDDYCIQIKSPDPNCWDDIQFYFESKRKISVKHPHDQWIQYLDVVFRHELAFRHNGTISDEGVSGTWKGEPDEYPSYIKWIELQNKNAKNNYPDFYKELFSNLMEYVPKDLKDK